MTKRTQKTHTPEEDIQSLEAHLAGTLKPVTPSREVIQRLRGRIQMPNREEITLRLTDWRRLFIVFGVIRLRASHIKYVTQRSGLRRRGVGILQ